MKCDHKGLAAITPEQLAELVCGSRLGHSRTIVPPVYYTKNCVSLVSIIISKPINTVPAGGAR